MINLFEQYKICVTVMCLYLVQVNGGKSNGFELTKHTEKDTNKPLYATQVGYDGAVYDIIRTYDKPNSNDIKVIICS